MDAKTLKKEDIQKETVYCLNDDDETEVLKEDIIQGMSVRKSFHCCLKDILFNVIRCRLGFVLLFV